LNNKKTEFFFFQLAPAGTGNDEEDKLLPPITEKPVQKETIESKRTGSIGLNVFTRYIRAGGCGIIGLSFLFTLFAATSATILLANWWLGRWSNSERARYTSVNSTNNCPTNQQSKIHTMTDVEWSSERDKYFYVLLGLSLLSVVLLFVRTLIYFVSCHITARSLHNQMFNALLRAPVLFFDTNPIGKNKGLAKGDFLFLFLGRVVNRFSKDVSSIDEQLSDVTYNFVDVKPELSSPFEIDFVLFRYFLILYQQSYS